MLSQSIFTAGRKKPIIQNAETIAREADTPNPIISYISEIALEAKATTVVTMARKSAVPTPKKRKKIRPAGDTSKTWGKFSVPE